MTQFLAYLLLFGGTLYFLSWWGKRGEKLGAKPEPSKPSRGFRPKTSPGEIWVQVYETHSVEEGRSFQARLQEEEVECILYEQGKKDIQGNLLKGIGIAVPKSAVSHAQNVINRMLA